MLPRAAIGFHSWLGIGTQACSSPSISHVLRTSPRSGLYYNGLHCPERVACVSTLQAPRVKKPAFEVGGDGKFVLDWKLRPRFSL